MRHLFRQIPNLFSPVKGPLIPSCSRLNIARHKTSYDGDGKSTMTILNIDVDLGLMVDTISVAGFRLNNGVTALGPIALFHRSLLSWKVSHARDITVESLSLFRVLEPHVDFVVMGLGDPEDTIAHSAQVTKLSKLANINTDIYCTEDACAVFNYLNSEGRNIAALLIPPIKLGIPSSDATAHRMRQHYSERQNKPLIA